MRGFFNEHLTYESEAVLAFLNFFRRSKYCTHFFKNFIKENECERKLEGRINPAHCAAMCRDFHKKFTKALPKFLYRFISCILIVSLVLMPSAAQAQSVLNLPVPGTMVPLSPAFVPVLLKGMTVHPEDPFQFDFIIDSGNTKFTPDQVKKESEKLVKYFLASMTVPKDDLWVNLSPYEQDRIIPEELGKTELGRDMLAQDYILKQLTASLMYPEEELGKKFWDRIYERAAKEFGTSETPVNTFNKVWILPDAATVYEHENTVYIVDAHLKVMLDSDYRAMDFQQKSTAQSRAPARGVAIQDENLDLQSSIIKEIILPEIEREVNEGEHFAPLRQIYHSLILAKWYKETVKNSLLNQIYADKNLINGIRIEDGKEKMEDGTTTNPSSNLDSQSSIVDQVYAQYMEAYKKGVFNYIKEDYDKLSNEVIPRKYFSGGFKLGAGKIYHSSSPMIVGNGIEGKGYKARVTMGMQKDGASSPVMESSIIGEFRAGTVDGIEVADISFDNQGKASEGRVVKIDPEQVALKLWVSPEGQGYDFSKYAVTEGAARKFGKIHKEFPGKTVYEYVTENPDSDNISFAVNGHQGNFWTGNSAAIVNGQLITKRAPGVGQESREALKGVHSFFVFDKDRIGLLDIDFDSSDAEETIQSVNYALTGPVLRRNTEDVSHDIRPAQMPPKGSNDVTWETWDRSQPFSVVGINEDGQIVQFSTEVAVTLDDINALVTKLGLTDVIVLGTSADVQQYVRGEAEEGFIQAKPADDTVTGEPGRSLGSIIYAESQSSSPVSVSQKEAEEYQQEVKDRFRDYEKSARKAFNPLLTDPKIVSEKIRKNNGYGESIFHHIPVNSDEKIVQVYADTQRIVRDVLGKDTEVINMDPNEIHITIVNDDVAPREELTLTLDQLRDEVAEDVKGVKPFEITLIGPRLMEDGVVVMEYTTSAPEFRYLRKRATNRFTERMEKKVLSEGNNGSVPKIIHSTVSVIRDHKISQRKLSALFERLNQYRQKMSAIDFEVRRLMVTHLQESNRRFIESETIPLDMKAPDDEESSSSPVNKPELTVELIEGVKVARLKTNAQYFQYEVSVDGNLHNRLMWDGFQGNAFLDGEVVSDPKSFLLTKEDFYDKTMPGYIGVVPFGNIFWHPYYFLYKNGEFYYQAGEEERIRAGYVYPSFVMFNDGNVKYQEMTLDGQDAWFRENEKNIDTIISGTRLVKDGARVDLKTLHFEDIRHVFNFPIVRKVDPNIGYGRDMTIGRELVYSDEQARGRAYDGDALEISLDSYHLTREELEGAVVEAGYTLVYNREDVKKRGQVYIDSINNRLSIRLAFSKYPQMIMAGDKNGDISFYAFGGKSGQEGLDLSAIQKILVKDGIQNAIILCNGSDVFMNYEGQDILPSWNGRDIFASMIFIRPRMSNNNNEAKDSISSPVSSTEDVGGIDMNNIDVDRQGSSVSIQFDPINVEEFMNMDFDGLTPVIINLTPLPSVLPLLGLVPQREEEEFELSKG